MSQLDDIKRDIEACRTYNFGMTQANRLAHEDADKLVSVIEAVRAAVQSIGQTADAMDEHFPETAAHIRISAIPILDALKAVTE